MARPENYKLTFTPDLEKATFEGDETISIRVLKSTSQITLNAADIDFHEVSITCGGANQKATATPDKEKEMVVLSVDKPLAAGAATIHINYTGILNSEMRGLYIGKDDQGASMPLRNSSPPMPGVRFLPLTNPITKQLSTSQPWPTKGMWRSRIPK